jgi:uncharacterized coiled-coil protein SlyX
MKKAVPTIAAALIVALIFTLSWAISLNSEYKYLNNQFAELADRIAVLTEQSVALDASTSELSASVAEAERVNAAAHREIERLTRELENSQGANAYGGNPFIVAIDARLETELTDMVRRHFAAIADGDRAAYIDTLLGGDSESSEYLLARFDEQAGTARTITAMYSSLSWEDSEYDAENKLTQGGWYLVVEYRDDNSGESGTYYVGVSRKVGDNAWAVYDYD